MTDGATSPGEQVPDVTVVIPVYNSMPYVVTTLASLMEQTLGRERLEVIAVDDGSTDGSGEQLDLLAASWAVLQAVHIPASGGPSRPRNVGIDRARGRYVFFLDADDYLGPEALERMVEQADRLGSDLVTCRRQPVGGRKVHGPLAKRARHEGVDADRYDAAFRRSGVVKDWEPVMIGFSDCKHLFRRSRIEALGLRFADAVNFGEDTLFSGTFLEADRLSMVSDYDCYYERLRDDGRNGTTLLAGTPSHLAGVELGLNLQRDRPELQWRNAAHLREALIDQAQSIFGDRFLDHDLPTRQRMVAHAAEILATWLTPRGLVGLEALDRVKIDLLRRGREEELTAFLRAVAAHGRGVDVVREGRVYAGYPFFGDEAVGVPDACYEVTGELPVRHHLAGAWWEGSVLVLRGHAFVEHVSTWEVSTEVVLRERYGRGERRWPVRVCASPELVAEGGGLYDYSRAGFEVRVDTADAGLVAGTWTAFLAVGAQGVTRQAPLGGHRDPGVEATLLAVPEPAGACPARAGTVAAAFTSYGSLTVTVGGGSA